MGLLAAGFSGCVAHRQTVDVTKTAVSETDLAARFLQTPLENHRCKAAIFPHAKAGWRVVRVSPIAGRGPSFVTALEALCREADGLKLPAVVDIFYARTPSGWSVNHEVRGTAVSYEAGFTPPQPPKLSEIKPPQMPQTTDDEPAPQGEGGKKS